MDLEPATDDLLVVAQYAVAGDGAAAGDAAAGDAAAAAPGTAPEPRAAVADAFGGETRLEFEFGGDSSSSWESGDEELATHEPIDRADLPAWIRKRDAANGRH